MGSFYLGLTGNALPTHWLTEGQRFPSVLVARIPGLKRETWGTRPVRQRRLIYESFDSIYFQASDW